MLLFSRKAALLAVAVPALFLSAQSFAQTTTIPVISGSIEGSISGCDDPNNNQTFNIAISFGGGDVGIDTNITFTLNFAGAGAQTITVPIPTSDVEAFVQAVGTSGITTQIPSTPVGFGCLLEATVSFSAIGDINNINPQVIASNALTTQSEVDSFVRGQPVANSNRIRGVLRGVGSSMQASASGFNVSGMSAAEGDSMPVGAWFGYSYSDTENDFVSTAFTSARHSVLFGLDTMPGDNWLLGVSVGLERSDVKTRFNNGAQEITSITLAPYVGVLLTDWLTLDMTGGISDVQNDQFRFQGATRITSDVESIRVFANANLAATYAYDALRLTGLAGALWATQRDDDFRESNGGITPEASFNVGRFLLGGEIAYSAGAWEPYASGTFEHDFTRTSQQFAAGVLAPKNDDSDVLVALGLRYFGNAGISGSVEYSTLLGRRDIDEDTISANIRWQF